MIQKRGCYTRREHGKYNSEEIKREASKLFSYEHIGRKIVDIYYEVLNQKN